MQINLANEQRMFLFEDDNDDKTYNTAFVIQFYGCSVCYKIKNFSGFKQPILLRKKRL